MIINNQQTYILNFQTFVPLSSDVNCKEIIDALKTCDETATVRTNDLGVSHIRYLLVPFLRNL